MGGWNDEPEYTPPNPPVWVWVAAAVAVLLIGALIGLNGL